MTTTTDTPRYRLDTTKVAEQAFEATGGADWGDCTNWWVIFSEGNYRITDFMP